MAAVAGVVTGIFSVGTDRPGRGDTARFTAHHTLTTVSLIGQYTSHVTEICLWLEEERGCVYSHGIT